MTTTTTNTAKGSSNTSSSTTTSNNTNDFEEEITLNDQRDVDTILAEELNSMSVQERELIYEEIHGVDPLIDETPEFVQSHLELLELELQQISEKPAYDLAESMSKEYVTSNKFRIMFLRADNFKSRKAAKRLVNFFEGRLRLFGKETLVRPLKLTDLDDGDRAALESGCYQFLPSRDRSGRVVFLDIRNMVPKTWKRGLNLVKASSYLIMSALEDEETQRRGVVALMYHMGTTVEVDGELMKEGPAAMLYLPFKLTCAHLCFGNPWINAYARALLGVAGRDFRARARLHSGSHTELQYSLMTFGLPMDLFPVTMEGDVKKTNQEKWLAKRKRKESLSYNAATVFHGIDMPGRHDVLVGKGKPFQRHIGNIRLRTMVESLLDQYNAAPKGEKYLVTQKVLITIREQGGGRFLKKERRTDWWTEVSDADALDKISKLFLSVNASSKAATTKNDGTEATSMAKRMRQSQEEKCSSKTTTAVSFCRNCCGFLDTVPTDM